MYALVPQQQAHTVPQQAVQQQTHTVQQHEQLQYQQRLSQQSLMQQAAMLQQQQPIYHPGLLAAMPQIESIPSGNLPPGFDATSCRSV
jgi:hypothetical protein